MRFYFAAGRWSVRGTGSLTSLAGWLQQAPGAGKHSRIGIARQGWELDRRAEEELWARLTL